MLSDLRFLISTFDVRDRARLVIFVVAQVFASLIDLVGLAVVLPLMDVLLGADMTQGYLGTISMVLGDPDRQTFVITLAGIMVVAFAAKAAVSLGLLWWSSGLVIRLQIMTSGRLLAAFVHQDYLDYRRSNLANMVRVIDAGAGDAHNKVLGGMLQLIASSLSMAAVFALLLVVSPLATLVAVIYFGGVVLVIQRVLAVRNRRAGQAAVEAAGRRTFALYNAILGFREIRMHDAEGLFLADFDRANDDAGTQARKANLYSVVPRYLLEVAAITGIAVLLTVVAGSAGPGGAMPVVSLFVAASIKLLPPLSSLTSTLGAIQNGRAGLALVVEAIRAATTRREAGGPSAAPSDEPVSLESMTVDGVTFRYPDGSEPVLRDVSMVIPAGSSVALCGASGSGKTTLVDILLGLIRPDEGHVSFGGVGIDDLGRRWHQIAAYVPQDVYLVDSSLASNVAFGIPEDQWDTDRIREALVKAELGDLIEQLPDGLGSKLGDRGSRLSGGQRQRIGIARALYRRPRVVVLDEATSALDNDTEDRISRTIRGLSGEVTTVVVAHRLSTVRHVDQLVFIKNGAIETIGSFETVRATSPDFARLVKLGNLDAALDSA